MTPILDTILAWSRDRPRWQQDALRRIIEQSALTAQDQADILVNCKAEHGIGDPAHSTVRFLDAAPATDGTGTLTPTVRLTRVHGVEHVNALHAEQVLEIAPNGLTVVYGDNGSGKSGYVRVLKQVCRARGAADIIHSNVYTAGNELQTARAHVCYRAETAPAVAAASGQATGILALESVQEETVSWTHGVVPPESLAQVSVFDTRTAAVYVSGENDVAYLP